MDQTPSLCYASNFHWVPLFVSPNPFKKILRDGSRGVRVDDPSDIELDCAIKRTKLAPDDQIKLKEVGNKFAAKIQHDAASEMYTSALHQSMDDVPTVLSNSAQAFIGLQKWAPAINDAAASLTVRPFKTSEWKGRFVKRSHPKKIRRSLTEFSLLIFRPFNNEWTKYEQMITNYQETKRIMSKRIQMPLLHIPNRYNLVVGRPKPC